MFRTTLNKLCCAVTLAVLMLAIALPATAADKKGPKGVHSNAPNLQWKTKFLGNLVLFTNFTGVNHHHWNRSNGYFLDAPQFFNQVVGEAFVAGSSATFSDTILPLGLYVSPGGGCCGPHPNVYLMSDSGNGTGPSAVLDGPLTQQWGISKFSDGSDLVEFDCVTCPTLSEGTMYWIVGQETETNFELTWDFARGDIANGNNFVFNQEGSITPAGGWLQVDGFNRSAFSVEGN